MTHLSIALAQQPTSTLLAEGATGTSHLESGSPDSLPMCTWRMHSVLHVGTCILDVHVPVRTKCSTKKPRISSENQVFLSKSTVSIKTKCDERAGVLAEPMTSTSLSSYLHPSPRKKQKQNDARAHLAVLTTLEIRMRHLSDTIRDAEARRDRLAAAHMQRQLEASRQAGPQAGDDATMQEAGSTVPAAEPRNSPATPLQAPGDLASIPTLLYGPPSQPAPPPGSAAPSPSPLGTLPAGGTPGASPAGILGSGPSLQEPSPVLSLQGSLVPQLSPLVSPPGPQAPALGLVSLGDLWRGAEAALPHRRGARPRKRPVDYDLVYPHITQHYLLASLAGFSSEV